MTEQNGSDRIRAPLSNADRSTLDAARRESIRDEVLDVVVERLARALAGLRESAPPVLALTEVFPDAWSGYARPASVEYVDAPGVVARIG